MKSDPKGKPKKRSATKAQLKSLHGQIKPSGSSEKSVNLQKSKRTEISKQIPGIQEIEFNPDKTKDLILKESLKIISEHGVQSLSMREVARNLGISHGTPYRHFATKEDVVFELGVIGFRQFTMTLESNLPIPTSKELLLQRFSKLKENYIRFATENPELYNIIFNTKLPEKEDSSELKMVAGQSFAVLVNQVASLKTAGLLDTEDVFSASMLIFTQLHGHIMLQNSGVISGLIHGFQYEKDVMLEINTHMGKILNIGFKP